METILLYIFIISTSVPNDVSEVTINNPSHAVIIMKKDGEESWSTKNDNKAVGLTQDDKIKYENFSIVIKSSKGTMSPIDLKHFFKVDTSVKIEKISKIEMVDKSSGGPIMIQRKENEIILSDKQSFFFKKPVRITWTSN